MYSVYTKVRLVTERCSNRCGISGQAVRTDREAHSIILSMTAAHGKISDDSKQYP